VLIIDLRQNVEMQSDDEFPDLTSKLRFLSVLDGKPNCIVQAEGGFFQLPNNCDRFASLDRCIPSIE